MKAMPHPSNRRQDTHQVTDLAAETTSLIERVQQTKQALVLTQSGQDAAVVVDIEQYHRLLDELELLRDIHTADEQIARGEGVPHDVARARVLKALA